jgi:hypothetical protein
LQKYKHLTPELKERIALLEKELEKFCVEILNRYREDFKRIGLRLEIMIVRIMGYTSPDTLSSGDCFTPGYSSSVSWGAIESEAAEDDDGGWQEHIAIWKCEKSFFRLHGMLMEETLSAIKEEITESIIEFLEGMKQETI